MVFQHKVEIIKDLPNKVSEIKIGIKKRYGDSCRWITLK